MLAGTASQLWTCTITLISTSQNAGKEKKNLAKKVIKYDGVWECEETDLLKMMSAKTKGQI